MFEIGYERVLDIASDPVVSDDVLRLDILDVILTFGYGCSGTDGRFGSVGVGIHHQADIVKVNTFELDGGSGRTVNDGAVGTEISLQVNRRSGESGKNE
jgi:hypothetical protein